ncbi:DUF5518 domain-containing protein [Halalkalicoccus jeotgali]|uniref:Uncharacterized protein n=1 Tax=Halalkalicoccus jeotgali (strain DSM 18796 / CECT 7217 / JCM 14584 / KCTC 4019 / B3) TaxID=795797 RepID=D8J702_HALJB|nr:DUF5518 domain-containing protein [Halalkalicoccus jeotgali]ADJ15955.1 hypothetical protein HacjB3_12870 [Halalkalicoccus jeotgali B3]ELY38051.1 hypothetical protein C497_08074 [Halalkalicoccus jeotgali B3]
MSARSSWNVNNSFDDDLRTATLLGFASIPATVALNWQGDPSSIEGEALFLACVLAGYLYADRSMGSTHAGAQTALIGTIPVVVWWLIELISQPISDSFGLAFLFVAGPIVLIGGVLLVVLMGALCAVGGDLLHRLLDRIRAGAVRN